ATTSEAAIEANTESVKSSTETTFYQIAPERARRPDAWRITASGMPQEKRAAFLLSASPLC
ncbi:hypothetical protein, partial [Alkalilimnicola sp. S0819]|uniref:hypothetical protein n=1 Tax=Alkalilimnicola sp. S0819 TaxID=2613922 RepID=UPI001D015F70